MSYKIFMAAIDDFFKALSDNQELEKQSQQRN